MYVCMYCDVLNSYVPINQTNRYIIYIQYIDHRKLQLPVCQQDLKFLYVWYVCVHVMNTTSTVPIYTSLPKLIYRVVLYTDDVYALFHHITIFI